MINDLPTGISHTYESKLVENWDEVNELGAKGWRPVMMVRNYYLVTRAWPRAVTISTSSASRERGGDI